MNTNRMTPPIAPVGLDYAAEATARAGYRVEVADLALAEDPEAELGRRLTSLQPRLVGLSFRNVDDCFWPSARSFLGELECLLGKIRGWTDAPVVLGGVGFSIFAEAILRRTGAEFGIVGDGEVGIPALLSAVGDGRRFEEVPGLVWREGAAVRSNPAAWPLDPHAGTSRSWIDNATYFRRGGQIGVETKRGCDRACIYCADRLAKGTRARVRPPAKVADEIESLLEQGVDVLHLCDAEFNVPGHHALAVCREMIRRKLGERVRWYAYLAVLPFDDQLAGEMAAAGCVGINFTGDSASAAMLEVYRQPHRAADLADAVRLCRRHGMAVMIDLLLGGPGETPETVAETVRFVDQIEPDCAGAALGIRIYPGTPVATLIAENGWLSRGDGIFRRYEGGLDLLEPTFFISPHLGPRPAELVREILGDNRRFFPPQPESPAADAGGAHDHNYNDNATLAEAIAAGARGAYWHILHQLRSS
ncbi:MAG: B12-binding domain-containing radical SAM protein [Thermoguttaceae bacterium]